MSNKQVTTDLVNQYIFQEQVLKKEQQAIIDREQLLTHNLLLYEMLSQIAAFPAGLLKEFYYAIKQQEIEVILVLRKRITSLSRRLLKKG